MEIGVTVEEIFHGDWRVSLSSFLRPPAGSYSATSYASQEEALKAARDGYYD